MKFQFYQFKSIRDDLRLHKRSTEHFHITYNSVKFDIIFDIDHDQENYELLIGATYKTWGYVLNMDHQFRIEMPDRCFFELRDILDLQYSERRFTSFQFLKYIADHVPKRCAYLPTDPSVLLRFRKDEIRQSDDPHKTVFIGWNDHKIDGRQARNFDKTELLLGKDCAEYCRRHNISSMWTTPDESYKRKDVFYPNGFTQNAK